MWILIVYLVMRNTNKSVKQEIKLPDNNIIPDTIILNETILPFQESSENIMNEISSKKYRYF